MSAVAKLFKNGNSQAVRLPKEFRFESQDEVFIKNVEDGVLLMPTTDNSVWEHLFNRLNEFSDDYMDSSRVQPTQSREDMFS